MCLDVCGIGVVVRENIKAKWTSDVASWFDGGDDVRLVSDAASIVEAISGVLDS